MTQRVTADPSGREQAARALATGAIVSFPTDTAYALAAGPEHPAALAGIYRMKGRPAHLPLIVLAASRAELADWAVLSPEAERLARAFWPGPLTLVLPAGPRARAPIATPEGTVGVRIPAHPIAAALLARTGPLATTSANRSGAPSPRSAEDVERQLGTDPDLAILLDSGPTSHDADSTVLSLVGRPRILRAGALTAQQLGIIT